MSENNSKKHKDESTLITLQRKHTPEGKSDEEKMANTGKGDENFGIKIDPYDISEVSLSSKN